MGDSLTISTVPSRKRICHVIESGTTGALEMMLLASETQRARGYRMLIIYCKRPGAPADLRARVHPDIDLIELRMRPLFPHLPGWFLIVANKLRNWNPDILILHGSFAGFFGRLAAGPNFRGDLLYCTHCISLMHLEFSRLQCRLFLTLEKFAQFVSPSIYVATSQQEKIVIARDIGVPVHVLVNAVDDYRIKEFWHPVRKRKELQRVITCARICPQKDPKLFAEICRSVQSTHPEVKFEWIGDGDHRLRLLLQQAGVSVVGWLDRKEALMSLADACVYLSTSIYETTSLSIIEAMFLKVPVLCRNAEWSKEMIRDGETGFLFDNKDSASILLSEYSGWSEKITKAAEADALERFSMERYSNDLERICRDVRNFPNRQCDR